MKTPTRLALPSAASKTERIHFITPPLAPRNAARTGIASASRPLCRGSNRRWSARLGVATQRTRIRAMKRKWGACRPRSGDIVFNLELAKHPPAAIDYVVLRELAHLLEASNGPALSSHPLRAHAGLARRRNRPQRPGHDAGVRRRCRAVFTTGACRNGTGIFETAMNCF